MVLVSFFLIEPNKNFVNSLTYLFTQSPVDSLCARQWTIPMKARGKTISPSYTLQIQNQEDFFCILKMRCWVHVFFTCRCSHF